ncbi:MAG: winged helix-turn-helix domain-containing protein [Microthrixaceae bacterium]
MSAAESKPSWTFLSNHGHVLLCIAADSRIRGRDIAEQVGITERAAQSIVADLVEAGYVRRDKVGRRNQYEINSDLPLRHPVEHEHSIGELLVALTGPPSDLTRR